MGTGTAIPWAQHTWNPWQGCTKVAGSRACEHCYMEREKRRYGQDPFTVVRSAPATFRAPVAKHLGGAYRWPDGDRVFACSWADWFHPAADPWREEAWELVRRRPGLRFLLLTKRPERLPRCLPADWGQGYPNVGLGVTLEDGDHEDRLERLVRTPAKLRFLSLEPLLGPVHLPLRALLRLHWLIVGGETGPEARPTHPDWVRWVRDRAQECGIPFFFKGWGEWSSGEAIKPGFPHIALGRDGREVPETTSFFSLDPHAAYLQRWGRQYTGNRLDGRTWEEVPE